MTFANKLDFLLNLTETSNVELARAIHMDPSLVSRLRRGMREMPKNSAYRGVISEFFAHKCDVEYRRFALSEMIGQRFLRTIVETDVIAAALNDWLSGDIDNAQKMAGCFLREFDQFTTSYQNPSPEENAGENTSWNRSKFYSYYGNEGKRKAVRVFLERLLARSEPCTIKITSDESLEWILESAAFSNELGLQMSCLAERGFQYQCIVALISNVSHAFDLLKRWLPCYMTGNAETYYYPLLRDGVHRRTLFVVPGEMALASSSIGEQKESGTSFLTFNEKTVSTYAKEFLDYWALCRPITQAFEGERITDFLLKLAVNYEDRLGPCIQQSGSLSLISAPDSVVSRLPIDFAAPYDNKLLRLLREKSFFFTNILAGYPVTDVIRLAAPEEILSGCVPIAGSPMFCGQTLYYVPEDYKLHLMQIVAYLEQYEKYHVILTDGVGPISSIHYVSQGDRVILVRKTDPVILLSISESHMVAAFWEYMNRTLVSSECTDLASRSETIARLRALIHALEEHGV